MRRIVPVYHVSIPDRGFFNRFGKKSVCSPGVSGCETAFRQDANILKRFRHQNNLEQYGRSALY
jgi:hypothetical protein